MKIIKKIKKKILRKLSSKIEEKEKVYNYFKKKEILECFNQFE